MDGYKSYTHTDHAVRLRIRKRSPRWEWPSIIGTLPQQNLLFIIQSVPVGSSVS